MNRTGIFALYIMRGKISPSFEKHENEVDVMQRIKQTKQDFIVLLSETKETLDEQLALPQIGT